MNHNLLPHKASDPFIGFENAPVQRLLQLLVEFDRFGIDMPSPMFCGPSSQSTVTVATDVLNDYEEQHVSGDRTVLTASSGSQWHIMCIIVEFGQCFCRIGQIE